MARKLYELPCADDRRFSPCCWRTRMTLEAMHAARNDQGPALEAACAPLRATLADQPFLCGGAPAYGDYIVFGSFQFARCVSPTRLLAPDDPLYAWRGRLLDLYGGLARSVPAYPE